LSFEFFVDSRFFFVRSFVRSLVEDIGASKSLCAVRLPHAMVPVYAFGLIQRNCARQLFNAFGAISHALAAANARNFEFINSIFLKK